VDGPKSLLLLLKKKEKNENEAERKDAASANRSEMEKYLNTQRVYMNTLKRTVRSDNPHTDIHTQIDRLPEQKKRD
jgi:hypothetical protein